MNNQNLLYWLKGYFEVGELNDSHGFNEGVAKMFADHIDLVKEETMFLCGFTEWLRGVLATYDIMTKGDKRDYNSEIHLLIKNRLDKEFNKVTRTADEIIHITSPLGLDNSRTCANTETSLPVEPDCAPPPILNFPNNPVMPRTGTKFCSK